MENDRKKGAKQNGAIFLSLLALMAYRTGRDASYGREACHSGMQMNYFAASSGVSS